MREIACVASVVLPQLVTLADDFIRAMRTVQTAAELHRLMEAVSREFGCRYWALIHHADLAESDRVDLKEYPAAIVQQLIGEGKYRRDPVIRGSLFAGGAFLWSDLPSLIHIDRFDRSRLEAGKREGLNEGITVPYFRLGDYMGSCTFAGMRQPERAPHFLGPAQMIGIFAFQAALRLLASGGAPVPPPRLQPRPRDCVALAGRGFTNKEIARALSLMPRTVDGYLTEARRLFAAHDRTELVIAAVLAGEVGLGEIGRRQPG